MLTPDERSSGPDQAEVEAAVRATLLGWGAELDTLQKFWRMDWNRMIADVVEAKRTSSPVLYPRLARTLRRTENFTVTVRYCIY